ncbi:hypothetical protein Dimus_029556 [Dionaea muscipula]
MIADFTTCYRLKLLINGEGVLIPRRPFQYKLRSCSSCKGGGGGRVTEMGVCPHNRFDCRCRRLLGHSKLRSFASSGGDRWVHPVNGDVDDSDSSDGFDEEDEDFDEFEEDDGLSYFRGLVLDGSYRPVNVVCWKRAICMEYMEKADVLEYYSRTVNSPSGSFYIPAVLRVPYLLQVVKKRRVRNVLSRRNVFRRDNYTCQYCSSGNNLTLDHVVPVAQGGKRTWENLVTACYRCNSKKSHKTLVEANMALIKMPKAPKEYDLLSVPLTSVAVHKLKMKKEMPEEWQQYLSKVMSLGKIDD